MDHFALAVGSLDQDELRRALVLSSLFAFFSVKAILIEKRDL
jgi:hypothetical protein